MLLTAVIAAAACFQQVQAEETQTPETTQPTITDASDYSVYNGYQYTIIQWTGGQSGQAGSGVNKAQGIFYGPWKTTTYDEATNSLVVGTQYSGNFANAFTEENWNTLMLDASNSAGADATGQYDAGPVKISGLIVTQGSNIDTLKANGNGRATEIGKTGGATGYTTIAKDFTFDLSGSSLTLAGTQVWNISNGATYTIKNTGAFTNTGSLTVNGTLNLSKTLTNTGSLTLGESGKVVIDSLDGFDAGSFSGVDYTAANGVQAVNTTKAIIKGGTTNLSSVVYNGETVSLTNGMLASDQTSNVYVVTSGTATVGGDNATEGTAGVAGYAVGENGTLVFAETKQGNFSSVVQGTGRVEVTLNNPGNGTGHGNAVQFGENFNGTLAITDGYMDLTDFVVGSNAVLELKTGQHWNSGNKTISNDINLIADSANGYVIRNSDTLTLTGKVTAKYLDLGTTHSNNGTLVLANENNAIQYVNVGQGGNVMTLAVAADMGFTKVTTADHTGAKVQVRDGKTMTLNGGNAEGDNSSYIATLEAAGGSVALGEGVTLTLGASSGNTASNSSIGTLTADAAGNTINLNAKAVLNINRVDGGAVTIGGSGTYKLGNTVTMTSGVTLANNWTGSVMVSGTDNGTTLTRYSIYGTNNSQNLASINALDTTADGKVILSGVDGWLMAKDTPGADETLTADIELVNYTIGENSYAALRIDNGYGRDSSGRYSIISGKISGTGDIEFAKGTSDAQYNLRGDISGWTGTLKSTKNTMYVVLQGNATSVNAAILEEQGENNNGTIHLTVDNAGKETTFSREVKVNKLNITAGSTMTVTAVEDAAPAAEGEAAGSPTSLLSAKEITFGQGAKLNVTGSITLDAANIKLAEGYTFSSADAVTLMQVTNGDLTLNNVGSWTGSGTYEFGSSRYTTSLSANGGLLQIVFNQEIIDQNLNLVVNSALLTGDVLTLNLNGDLTAGCNVDLTLSADALAYIAGKTGEVDLSLVAGNGTFTSVAGEANFVNVSFYNGAYTGEVGGKFRVEYIPEPTTATLSLLALAGLAARRRRR